MAPPKALDPRSRHTARVAMRRTPLASTTVTLLIGAALVGACSPDRGVETGPASTIAIAVPTAPAHPSAPLSARADAVPSAIRRTPPTAAYGTNP
jgi:hypothetical protein